MNFYNLFSSLIDGIDPITETKFSPDDPLLDPAVKQRLIEIRDEIAEKNEVRRAIRHNEITLRVNVMPGIRIDYPQVSFKDFAINISLSKAVETLGVNGNIITKQTKPILIKERIFDYLVSIGALIEQHNMNNKLFYSVTPKGQDLGILVKEDTRYPGGLAEWITVGLQKKLIAELPQIING